jgi:uroporphyrinogen decarboxylase
VLLSSAYAGAGFISRRHYERFVLPYEHTIIDALKAEFPGRPVYTHTCGAIGDRLDLMLQTGTHGIDTLDPPPLGTVDLADAVARLAGRVFIKGNVDPVNTILRGTAGDCYRDARQRIAIAGRNGGYILSTACSVPPHAPPENILQLVRASEDAA